MDTNTNKTDALRERSNALRSTRSLIRVIRAFLWVVIIASAIVAVAALASMYLNGESAYVVLTPKGESLRATGLLVAVVLVIVASLLVIFCERINNQIDNQLERCRRIRHARTVKARDQRMQAHGAALLPAGTETVPASDEAREAAGASL